VRDLITTLAGKIIHPVFGLPGGVARRVSADEQRRCAEIAAQAVEFGLFTLGVFDDVVLKNPAYVEWILSEGYTHRTHYMGLVDDRNRLNFYDGMIRVVDPEGHERVRFKAQQYAEHVAEHVEPWSYVKFPYLRDVGWRGFEEGPDSGIYAVAPLARLNVADAMPTPRAQEAFERYVEILGGRPVHHSLANHWARIIELIAAAEMMQELAADEAFVSPEIRTIPTAVPTEGIGVVEAPRGTLFHHYRTDDNGILTQANLIVATQNNAARIAMSVDRAARTLINKGHVDDGILNKIEMAFRAYDPCHGCATHSLPGQMPLIVRLFDHRHTLVDEIRRDHLAAEGVAP